jgi:hypothetical protein
MIISLSSAKCTQISQMEKQPKTGSDSENRVHNNGQALANQGDMSMIYAAMMVN